MANLTTDIRAKFAKGAGLQTGVSTAGVEDNNYRNRTYGADGVTQVDTYRVDAEDNLHLGGSPALKPTWRPLIFRAVLNGAIVTTRFHIFNVSGRIKRITEIHSTAGDHASAVTLHVTKETTGQAAGAGTSVMSGTFNLKGTADTEQTATLSTAKDSVATHITEFAAGEMLSVKLTGTATTAAGVLIVVWVQYDLPVFEVSWWSAAVTSQDQGFFIANRNYPIRAIRYVHGVAETTDTTANVQVTVDDGTEAPGAGTDALTNDTNAGFDINAIANVVQLGVLAAATTMIAGERLSVDFNSTQTEGAGICITACLNTEEAGRIEVPFWLYDTNVVDFWFFSSDRSYELWDGRFLHAVAAGGVSTMNIEKSRGTTNASGGTAMLATAVDLNATANTVIIADVVTVKATYLISSGDRLSGDYANTEQSTVGVLFTLSLRTR